MIKCYFFIFATVLILKFSAQGWLPVGARSMSLSNTSVCLEDVWAFHHNPGALGTISKTSVGISYENRFLMKEFQSQGLAIAQPLKKGVLSIGAQFYGYNLYKTNRIGLGYSLKFSDKLFAGVQMNYQSLKISISGELGILAKINENVSFGFSVFNVNRAKLSVFQDDRFSTYLKMGISYAVSSKVLILAEAEKELSSKLRPKGALEYQVANRFFLRLGAAGNPVEMSFGVGYGLKSGFKLDLGTAWDQYLGWSPHFGLNFELNKKAE
jgi:hypothetical protein